MSHFVSKGANFDDLNAQLLSRNADTEAQSDDVEALEQALQRANVGHADGDAPVPGKIDGSYSYDAGETSASGAASHAGPSRSTSPRKGGFLAAPSTSTTPFTRSRKNSEDNLLAPPAIASQQRRTSDRHNRNRKLSDPDYAGRRQDTASPFQHGPTDSVPHSRPHSRLGQRQQRHDQSGDDATTHADSEQLHRPRAQRNVTFENDPASSVQNVSNGSAPGGYYVEPEQMGPSAARQEYDQPVDSQTLHHHHHHHHAHHHHSHHHHRFQTHSHQHAEIAAVTPRKLGTWDGVFMPVSLNILGIILFLRFGFILGQVGLLGALLLLTVSYAVDALTSMSVSAISTNGQVRGGGAYYLISRSLGPEFGGAIGLVFTIGQALNASMNVLGFVESLTDAFGESRTGFLPEGPWWNFSYGSVCLLISTLVCLIGSKLFAKATLALAIVLATAIISIPVSSLFVQPFIDLDRGAFYTGWSLTTLRDNLLPHFTSGAAGSSTGPYKETWQTVFGVLFPAVTGLLAGVSMSGDLRKPSKSIPKGTNWSLAFTYGVYVLSFVVFAGTIARQSFYLDVGIVSDIALSPQLITFGVLASTGFSALMGVMACGKVLQAIARDDLLPVLDIFAQGTNMSDTPVYAICATWFFCQSILFVDSVNIIAQLVTMTSLLTFGTLCFATLALKAGGAPSFRPSFRYWNIWTAGAGTLASFGAMFFTAPLSASACIVFAVFLFSAIHIFCPPKPWGDVTRNLNYHIVRKYLLRLDERKSRVTHWRPQILLLVNNARTDWNLIIFCNSLKKGALYVLGHVLKGEFGECLTELRKQQIAWLKLVDVTGIKSFVDVIIARDEREGARNLILSCGLGSMRPNIVCMGFPSHLPKAPVGKKSSSNGEQQDSEITIRPDEQSDVDNPHQVVDIRVLPTDIARRETPILPSTFVGIMEDTLALQKGLAVAYGFDSMSLSGPATQYRGKSSLDHGGEVYIDLWPIQIQSPDADASHAWDTYTMVLQLGTILSMTGSWKHHKLRVSVFVEHEDEVEEERLRVRSLLDNLRIPAALRVFALSSEQVSTYQCIVRGKEPVPAHVQHVLASDPWWDALKALRKEQERKKTELQAAAAAAAAATARSQAVPAASPSSKGSKSDARKQTKREQRLMGVSLPKEHLDFFNRNMRIGLAHPRASNVGRRRSESNTAARPFGISNDDSESEYSGSDSDDDSDLSDELARLDLDDLDWMSSSAGSGLRRSNTMSAAGSLRSNSMRKRRNNTARRQTASSWARLPDEPGLSPRAPLLQRRGSDATDGSYGSLSSTPRPSMFRNAKIAAEPTINETSNGSAPLGGSDGKSTLKAPGREQRAHRQQQLQDAGPGTDRSGRHRAVSNSQRRKKASEMRAGENGISNADTAQAFPASLPNPNTDTPLVSFNLLPNKAQYLILNELIRINSSASTSIVLTSLPAPETGTSQDPVKSLRYLEHLESLFSGGPPVLGVHAKQLTMTSAL